MRDELQPETSMGTDGKTNDEDYSILRSTEKQIQGINLASQMLEKKLGIKRELIRLALVEVLVAMQTKGSRYHYQTENDLPQFKVAMKKMMQPLLKSKLSSLLSTDNMECNLDVTLDDLFRWYMEEYLPANYPT